MPQLGSPHRRLLFPRSWTGLAIALLFVSATLQPNPAPAEGAAAADSAVLFFAPADDAYITAAQPASSFGSASALRADNSPVEQFLLKFNVSGVGGGKVVGAKLRLFCTNAATAGGNIHRLANPDAQWNEDTVTWDNAPAAATETVASLGDVLQGAWYEIDITSVVKGDGSVSLRVTSPSSNGAHYSSKEGGSGSAPQLVVTVDPPPAAPTGLSATAASASRVDLSWTASTSSDVVGYEIVRNGVSLANVGTVSTYSDTTVAPSTAYQYLVRARDAAGSVSSFSNAATVTTPSGMTTLTFSAIADTYASSLEPDRNFGSAQEIRTDSAPDVRGFVRFDPNGVGTPISRAIVRVLATSGNSTGIDVRGVTTNSWSETALTYNNMPGVLSIADSSGPITAGTWVEWDVTSLVSGNDPISFALTSMSSTATSLASRQSTNPPKLVVTFGSTASPSPSPSASPSPTPSASPSPSPSPTLSPSPSPSPLPDPVIAAAGDIACDPGSSHFKGGLGTPTACRQKYTADLLAGANAVLTLGDIQYEDATLTKFRNSYDLSWGRFKSITRPSIGNHEYLTAGASGYFDYYGAAAGPRGQGWYSFDLGKWHLIALNSNCSKVGGCGPGSPQYEWLRADLARSTLMCTAAYWHHPRFSHGQYDNDADYQPFWQLLYDDGAEVVLSSHDHNYQRYAPMTPSGARDDARGIRQFIVGTGGKNHYAVDSKAENREVANGDTFGVIKLTLRATGYTWRFVPEAGETFTDSGTGSCR